MLLWSTTGVDEKLIESVEILASFLATFFVVGINKTSMPLGTRMKGKVDWFCRKE